MTKMRESTWEMTVAIAAPATPIPKMKMKIGSKIRFVTAPIATVNMPVVA